MKKVLLSLALTLSTALMGFSQHSQTATGFTNTCEEIEVAGTNGFKFDLWPLDGGWDQSLVDTLKFGYYVVPNGGTMWTWMNLNNPVNLSSPNNKVKFDIAVNGANGADTTQTIGVKLEASGTVVTEEINLNLSQEFSTQNLTFTALDGQDLTAVTRITFTLSNPSTSGKIGILYLTNISAGSALVSSTNKASDLVSNTKLFPNPATETANIELNLVKVSDVKVTLTDLMGREVEVITETRGTEVKESFNVANLQKGLYTVNYFVDGAPAKAELLMVK